MNNPQTQQLHYMNMSATLLWHTLKKPWDRKMAKRLVLFNHKGGVSKTTTVYNLGWILSKKHRVLLVDADPQCNLTSLILRDDFDHYYVDDKTRLNNLKDGVSAAFSGKPIPIVAVDCPDVARAPNLHLLPGHANLSEYDAALTFAQNANNAITTLQNLPGAFNELIALTEKKYDIEYTLIDLNPGLSAINQNLFLNSDVFVVPTNPDPFSVMALGTLQTVLPRWANWKNNSLEIFAESAYPLRPGTPKFGGTIIQRFNVRNGRAAKPYRDNIDEIKSTVSNSLVPSLSKVGMTFPAEIYTDTFKLEGYCLEEIQDFGGLLPKAFNAGVPVFELSDREIGEAGSVLTDLAEKRDKLRAQLEGVATELISLMSNA
ncbi:ParA family protein [Pandoraea sp. NPDC087047]|uniref:ParA family protein n=1 Tax=Pandoraea sp. NPDC087047 TaxID=3364390 RepID=UPI00381E8FE3